MPSTLVLNADPDVCPAMGSVESCGAKYQPINCNKSAASILAESIWCLSDGQENAAIIIRSFFLRLNWV